MAIDPSSSLLRAARLVPGLMVAGVALALALGGAVYGTAWYPPAIGLAAALVFVLATSRRQRLGVLQRIGVGSALALTAWSYGSIAWAGLPGQSVTEANRTASYAIAVALVVLVADTPQRRRDLTIALAGASAVFAGYLIVRLNFGNPLGLFQYGRLTGPIGYPNAEAAFLMMGLWPLVALASSSSEPALIRVLALPAAAAIPSVALITISRAAAVFAVASIVAFFIVYPFRLRALLAVLVVFAPCLVGFSTLYAPQRAAVMTTSTVHAAGLVCAAGVAAALIIAVFWVLADQRFQLGLMIPRRLRLAIGVGAVAALLVSGGVLAARHDPATFLRQRWSAFKAGQGSDAKPNANRFLTSGSNRYDFWRVALLEVSERPWTGYGAGNWRWRYLQARHSDEEPSSAHGAIWDMAANLGVPGAVAYLALIGAAFAATLMPARREEAARQASLCAALIVGIGHSQVDWLWETPATGFLIAGLIGLALAGARRHEAPAPRLAGRLAIAAVTLVALVGFLPSLIAEQLTSSSYKATPGQAASLARNAASFAPFSADPELAVAHAELRRGNTTGATDAARSATQREPRDWYAWLSLADIAVRRHDHASTVVACAKATALNPTLRCPAPST